MSKSGMCVLHKIAAVLVIIGALNWGLVGVFHYNLVMAVVGSWPMVERLVYVLVGLAGLLMIGACKCCCGEACGMEKK